MRLIDADALLIHLADYQLQESSGWDANGREKRDAYEAITKCIRAIEEAPTITIDHIAEVSKKGDSISRQHAVDAFRKELCAEETGSGREYAISFSGIERVLNDLPPAQPKMPKWARKVEHMYNKALKMPYIQKPLAWALYQVWKEYDNE